MFDLLAVIYEYFAFRVFSVLVWAGGRSDPLLLYSRMFGFMSPMFEIQYDCMDFSLSMSQYNLYWL